LTFIRNKAQGIYYSLPKRADTKWKRRSIKVSINNHFKFKKKSTTYHTQTQSGSKNYTILYKDTKLKHNKTTIIMNTRTKYFILLSGSNRNTLRNQLYQWPSIKQTNMNYLFWKSSTKTRKTLWMARLQNYLQHKTSKTI
jgi:hypothetical protein